MQKILKLNLLALSVLLAQQSHALQALSDDSLSQVTGQDGITLSLESDIITADQINWKDNTTFADNTSDQLNLSLNNLWIYRNINDPITGSVKIDVGASATNKPQIGIDAQLNPANLYIGKIAVCGNGGMGANCDDISSLSMGALTLQNRSPLKFKLFTQNGLFSPTEQAYVELAVNNVNILHTLESQGMYHQLGLKDFNFNVKGNLYLYISPTRGIVASTNLPNIASSSNEIELARVDDLDNVGKTKPGFNVDLRFKRDVGPNFFDYGLTENDGNKALLRIGASGRLRDAELTINADRINLGAATLNGDTAGSDASGNTGLHLSAKASFTRDIKDSNGNVTSQGGRLEIGASGKNTFAVEFGDLTPIQIRKLEGGSLAVNSDLTRINFGDIYINTIKSDAMDFQIGQNIAALLGREAGIYRHTLYQNQPMDPNILAVAVRGFSLEGVARTGRFIADNSNDAANQALPSSGQWGIGIPIYNLNANVALFGTNFGVNTDKQGIGFGVAFSTDGRDAAGTKTTSLLLIDTSTSPSGEAYNGYAGLRNIDLFVDAKGALGLNSDGIEIELSKFVLAMGAEVAFGQLPGSRYGVAACTGSTNLNCFVPANSFTQATDVLFGLGLRLDGSGNLQIIPQRTTSSDLSFIANLNLAASSATENRNYVRISDKSNGASLGVDRLAGELTATTDLKLKNNSINLDTTVNLNPTRSASKVITADLNLYPNATSTAQNFGRIAFTGGNIRSVIGITPR